MADKKITDDSLLSGASVDLANDVIPIVDVSEASPSDRNKKITPSELKIALDVPSGLANVLTGGNDGGGFQIKNIANPTLAQDAATKDYVDNKTSLTDVDASGGTFPSGALRGAEYQVTVAGVLGGEYVPIGSILKARQNAPTNDWLITGWKLI